MALPTIEECLIWYFSLSIASLLLIGIFTCCAKKFKIDMHVISHWILSSLIFAIVSTTVFTINPFGVTAFIDSESIAKYLGYDPTIVRCAIVATGDVSGSYLYATYFGFCWITGTKMLKVEGLGIKLFGALGDNIFRAIMIVVIAPAVGGSEDAVLSPELNTVFGIFRKTSFVFFVAIYSLATSKCRHSKCCQCHFSSCELQEKYDSKNEKGYMRGSINELKQNYCCKVTNKDENLSECKIGVFICNFIFFFVRTSFCTCIYFAMSWVDNVSHFNDEIEFTILTILGILNVAFLFFIGEGQTKLVNTCCGSGGGRSIATVVSTPEAAAPETMATTTVATATVELTAAAVTPLPSNVVGNCNGDSDSFGNENEALKNDISVSVIY